MASLGLDGVNVRKMREFYIVIVDRSFLLPDWKYMAPSIILRHQWFKSRSIFRSSSSMATRYVDGTPTSEVTRSLSGLHIHTHHGHTKVNIMFMNGRLTSLSFHVNRPSHSWDKAISNADLETSRSRSCVWSKGKVI